MYGINKLISVYIPATRLTCLLHYIKWAITAIFYINRLKWFKYIFQFNGISDHARPNLGGSAWPNNT